MSLIKVATKMITMPVAHLKGDHIELEQIRDLAKKLNAKVNEMEMDDKKAKAKYLKG